ncbi:MAG: hypothetical protein PUE83_04195 [Lachnobacterium sp.]|nr:hypothetical protein [Lachnobacterium sp.]
MDRLKIAQYIALVATLFSIVGIIAGGFDGSNIGGIFIGIGMIVGLVSYLFGGFLTAIKMSLKIAKFGWVIVPFPFDLITLFVSFVFAIIAFVFIPIIPIRRAYKNNLKL